MQKCMPTPPAYACTEIAPSSVQASTLEIMAMGGLFRGFPVAAKGLAPRVLICAIVRSEPRFPPPIPISWSRHSGCSRLLCAHRRPRARRQARCLPRSPATFPRPQVQADSSDGGASTWCRPPQLGHHVLQGGQILPSHPMMKYHQNIRP